MTKEKIIAIVAGVVALLLIGTGLFVILKPDALPTAKPGDEISIPLELSKNPGFNVADITVEYDVDNLLFVDAKCNNKFNITTPDDINGKVRCILDYSDSTKDIKDTGEVITLKFKVKDKAEPGEYTLIVSNDSKFASIEEKMVECKFKESKFVIKAKDK